MEILRSRMAAKMKTKPSEELFISASDEELFLVALVKRINQNQVSRTKKDDEWKQETLGQMNNGLDNRQISPMQILIIENFFKNMEKKQ